MSHQNLEDSIAYRLRQMATRFGATELTLTGTYVISPNSGTFHFLNPNGVNRTVRMPIIDTGGGQLFYVINSGVSGNLDIVDSSGVAIVSSSSGVTMMMISSPRAWRSAALSSTLTGAPSGAEYITSTADATLTAERVLTDSATLTWDRSVAGQIKGTAAGSGGGAPTDAEYVVAALSSGLSAERLLTNTATVTWDFSTAGQAKATAVAVGGNVSNTGTPTNVQYAKWTNATTIQGVSAATVLSDIGAAPLASPTFTGTPTLPTGSIGVTQTVGNNTTALATTAFVAGSISASGGGNVSNSGTPTIDQIGVWTAATTIKGVTATTLFREKLTTTRNYFVKPAASGGSDAADGLALGTAFATIQKAIDVASVLDLGAFSVNISVADGTYTAGMNCKSYSAGAGTINITGNNTTPTNCIISVTSGFPIQASTVRGPYTIQGFHLKALTAGFNCALITQLSQVSLNNMRFEGEIHIHTTYGAQVIVSGNISTAGNFNAHIFADLQSLVQEAGLTIANAHPIIITGTPVITQGWILANQGSTVVSNQNDYTRDGVNPQLATGPRYSVNSLSYVGTGTSASATYLPGNALGSTASGGIYD